jgi:hypothetical protein
MRRFRQDVGTDPWAPNRQGMRLHRLARMDLAIITVTAVIFLCVSSFLAGAYTASNSLKLQNCFSSGGPLQPGGTPCMHLSGEQRDLLRLAPQPSP